jgi:hypothetical protein
MSFKPTQLHLYIGGFTGPSYSLKMTKNGLIYSTRNFDPEDITATITPTEADWQAFITTLDRLDVWSWKKRYLNLDVCDGTQWSVLISHGNQLVQSGGDNAYPSRTGETDDPSKGDIFDLFLCAVRKLIGGRAFH